MRTIPACTGKPRSRSFRSRASRDYPRMHGETSWEDGSTSHDEGLSPHARGNPRAGREREDHGGTIPACTGKPRVCRPWLASLEDYPRMHGETISAVYEPVFALGLSPHARGNRSPRPRRQVAVRTIPACTGKPDSPRVVLSRLEDYPRMHGETFGPVSASRAIGGLSPHARGNLQPQASAVGDAGTIPACTGKPAFRSRPAGG